MWKTCCLSHQSGSGLVLSFSYPYTLVHVLNDLMLYCQSQISLDFYCDLCQAYGIRLGLASVLQPSDPGADWGFSEPRHPLLCRPFSQSWRPWRKLGRGCTPSLGPTPPNSSSTIGKVWQHSAPSHQQRQSSLRPDPISQLCPCQCAYQTLPRIESSRSNLLSPEYGGPCWRDRLWNFRCRGSIIVLVSMLAGSIVEPWTYRVNRRACEQDSGSKRRIYMSLPGWQNRARQGARKSSNLY